MLPTIDGQAMASLQIRMPDELNDRLRALPAARENPAAFVRRLIIEAVAGDRSVRAEAPVRARGASTTLRLCPKDAARLDQEAAKMGFARATWLAALVARRFRGEARFSRADEFALVGIQMELRRIALSLVRLATGALEGADGDAGRLLDAQALAALATEVRGHMTSIRAAFKGNLDDWKVVDE